MMFYISDIQYLTEKATSVRREHQVTSDDFWSLDGVRTPRKESLGLVLLIIQWAGAYIARVFEH
jgi:hypothetical protein